MSISTYMPIRMGRTNTSTTNPGFHFQLINGLFKIFVFLRVLRGEILYLNGDVDFFNRQDLTKILRVDFDHEAAFASVDEYLVER